MFTHDDEEEMESEINRIEGQKKLFEQIRKRQSKYEVTEEEKLEVRKKQHRLCEHVLSVNNIDNFRSERRLKKNLMRKICGMLHLLKSLILKSRRFVVVVIFG